MRSLTLRLWWVSLWLAAVAVWGEVVPAAVEPAPTNEVDKAAARAAKKRARAEQAATQRESVITAEKIEFDNKEGVILFDENVLVDDEQFVMRSERLLVFMEGTNDVQQIMAIGNVVITNLNRAATCDKAVYIKKDGQIVMTGNARLGSQENRGGEVTGERIVFWLDDERMEVYPGRVVLPPGTFGKGGAGSLVPGMDLGGKEKKPKTGTAGAEKH